MSRTNNLKWGECKANYLAMKEGSNGEVPSSVSSHNEAKERPDSVIVK